MNRAFERQRVNALDGCLVKESVKMDRERERERDKRKSKCLDKRVLALK